MISLFGETVVVSAAGHSHRRDSGQQHVVSDAERGSGLSPESS